MTDLRRQVLALLRHTAEGFGADLPFAARIRIPVAAAAEAVSARPDRPQRTIPRPPATRPPDARPAAVRPARSRQTAARTATPQTAAVLTPAAPPIDLPDDLDGQRQKAVGCRRCRLCETRSTVVFGEGDPTADIMFVGEAPGAREDEQGRPFVGPAGQLLTRMIEGALGIPRTDTYIANVNKCRPPRNRNPEPDEVAACLPFLKAQIGSVRPKVLVALGRVAARNLLGDERSVTKLRGVDLQFEGTPVVVTWHPAYLLRQPDAKRETWEDLKRVNRILGRPEVPAPYRGR